MKKNYRKDGPDQRQILARRVITVMLSFMMVFTMMPWIAPEQGQVNAASYPSDYRDWNQGQSDYNEMRDVGCFIVAQAKMLREAGIAGGSFNPDTWYWYLRNRGHLSNPPYSLYMKYSGYLAPSNYASENGKKLKYWGSWDASDAQIWFNIGAGYYTILNVGGHYVMVDNATSSRTGEIYIYDSFNGWNTKHTAFGYFCDSPIKYHSRYGGASEGHVYQLESAPATVVKPSAPSNVKMSSADVGLNDAIAASWSAVSGASSYNVTLTCTTNSAYNQSKSVTGTNVSFQAAHAGTYKVSVTASNSAGSSGAASSSNSTVVHSNVTVKYVDWDGKQIGATQSIKYGGNATAPAAPSREGYTFQNWSSNGKGLKSDTTITAQYKINSYSVSFVDYNGDVIGNVQKVDYGSAATPPTDIPTKEGYIFSEWSTDEYKNVKKALTVKAVYVWENVNLPIITKVTSAKRNAESTGYDITVKISNFPDNFTKGKLVAALKTKDGKMVASEIKSVSMPSTGETTETMTILYSGVASQVEVSMIGVVDDETTGTPKAKAVTAPVDIGNEWSNWSTTVPTGDDIIKESRTEYRYKDRKIIKDTTTPSTPSGYTLTSTSNTGTYTAWGAWSGYSTAARSSSALQDVSTTTGYRYYAFQCGNCGTRDPYSGACSNCGSTNMYWVQDYGTCRGQDYSGGYTKMDNNKGRIYWQNKYWYFEFPGTSDGQGGTGQPTTTLYRYRTRQEYKNYTYWSTNWSSWSPTVATASDSRKVETRTTYRFKNNGTEVPCYNYKRYKFENVNTGKTVYTYTSAYADSMDFPGEWEYNVTFTQLNKVNTDTGDDVELYGGTGDASWYKADVNDEGEVTTFISKSSLEDTLGTKRVLEGKLDNAAGKVATLMVYKGSNDDPIASQIEYIGQQTVAEDGSYKFDYVTKEEPTAKTGDFVITLGIEGATNYLVLGKIDAPKAVYAVNFVDDEGNPIGEQKTVVSGGTVEAPEAPEKEGYEFIGWDTALKNITENTVVTAQYKKKTFTVIFVDWDDKDLEIKEFEYGDVLTADTNPTQEGKNFSKWLDESGKEAIVVKDNMIVTAEYVDATYCVQFTDWNGNVIKEQTVAYGEAAVPPADLEAPSENQVFKEWDKAGNIAFVNCSMVVSPVAKYVEDADEPVITVDSGNYAEPQKVGVYSLESGSDLYYSVQPIEEAKFIDAIIEDDYEKYESPFTVSESSVVFAYAKKNGKNASPAAFSIIKIGEEEDADVTAVTDAINAIPEVGSLTLEAETAVNYANGLYNTLNADQQQQVDAALVEKLNTAVARIAELKEEEANSEQVKADKAAADAVAAKINALPENITKDDSDQITAARTAYSNLTASQKQYISDETYLKLTKAEAAYQAILDQEEQEQQAAEASQRAIENVRNKINALPPSNELTLSDEAAVQAAQNAFDDLTADQQNQIESALVAKLNQAIGVIDFLKQYAEDEADQAAADKAAADAVKELINELPDASEVDWDTHSAQVEYVKGEFDKLTPEQRDLVPYSSYSKLESVIDALNAQDPREEREREKAENQRAVENVTSLINQLPDASDIKLTDKSLIEFAREKLDSLTDAQMELLSSAQYRALENKLSAAEKKLAALEKEAEETLNPSTDPGDDPSGDPCEKGHSFGEWKTVKQPTEIAGGEKVRYCKVCNAEERQSVPMLAPTLPAVKISKATAGKKSATVKWKKLSSAKRKKVKKIEIQYSKDKNFSNGVKTKYASAKKTSYKVKGLKKGKKYFVRIRAYTSSGGQVHVSKWSSTKKVKAK